MGSMAEVLKAIRYRNLNEAKSALREVLSETAVRILEDDGGEPQGLLSIIPADRLQEEDFYRLFDLKKGVLVEVERVDYSGYGPPAEEDLYMGFAAEGAAYVLAGCALSVSIENCPYQARDIHHLDALVLAKKHPLNREDLAERLKLPPDWTFDDLFELIVEGRLTGHEIDRLVHKGIQ